MALVLLLFCRRCRCFVIVVILLQLSATFYFIFHCRRRCCFVITVVVDFVAPVAAAAFILVLDNVDDDAD